MAKVYKVGIIGVGFIGPAHMEGIRRQGFEVVAIAEATQSLAEEAAERLLVPKAFGDWKDLIADPEIDVVHIASPNYLHYTHAKAALEAGKHVVCEKPLAMTAEESAELVEIAKEKNLVNAVNFNIRYYPWFRMQKHALMPENWVIVYISSRAATCRIGCYWIPIGIGAWNRSWEVSYALLRISVHIGWIL